MRIAIAVTAAMLIASAARADAVSDANAGVEALHRGDARAAIDLFSSAIESGTLAPNDLEYAYVELGNAQLQLGLIDHARRNADKALSLNPTDPDAKALWRNTTITAQPGAQEEFGHGGKILIFTCVNPNAPAVRPNIFEIDFLKRAWVRSPNFGEKGRKLLAQINGSVVTWHSHEENASLSLDQDMSIDSATGILTNRFSTSAGEQGRIIYQCSSVSGQ